MTDQPTPEQIAKRGTVERAAWDAAHAVWCGPDCSPTCTQWGGDRREIRAIVNAVRSFQN